MPQYKFESQRLNFREFSKNDFSLLHSLDSDPEVMRHISNGVPLTNEAIQASLDRVIARYQEWKGYGFWAAERKDNGEFVGWFALKPLPGTDEIEVGYRLRRDQWKQGFATEGTKKLIARGFEELNLNKIVAIANIPNLASHRVLEKSGLRYIGDTEYRSSQEAPPRQVCWFEVSRS